MIYLSDDYVSKYCDTLSYLISRSIYENYSFSYVERTLSYSRVLSELEKSNITIIAFSSMEKIYSELFPLKDNHDFVLNVYDAFGWCGWTYMHLFLDMGITFEALFYVIPLEEMLGLYHLYHEMSYSQTLEYAKSRIEYTILDIIMKSKKMSTIDIVNATNISFSTIKALRYGKRDIAKLEADKIVLIANYLNVKIESLLPNIHLQKSL